MKIKRGKEWVLYDDGDEGYLKEHGGKYIVHLSKEDYADCLMPHSAFPAILSQSRNLSKEELLRDHKAYRYLVDPITIYGYRLYKSKLNALMTAPFTLNNQSVNIWSHFFSGVYFLSLLLEVGKMKNCSNITYFSVISFIVSASSCFLLSSFR